MSCKEAPGQQGLVPKLPDLTCFALGAAGLVSDASVTSGVYGKAGAKIIVGGLRWGFLGKWTGAEEWTGKMAPVLASL